MIDPQLLRENPDVVRRSQTLRGEPVDLVDEAIAADAARRAAITAFEAVRAEQNAFGKTRRGGAEGREGGARRAGAGARRAGEGDPGRRERSGGGVRRRPRAASRTSCSTGCPAGGEDDFVTLREVGEKPAFDFEPRDHLELGELLDAIDMERGAKVSGARFYFLKGVGARLEIALMNLGARARARRRVHAAHHADAGAARDHGGHRLPRRARRRDLPPARRRPLPHRHERGRARRVPQGRDPGCVGRPAALRRLVDVLPPRGRAPDGKDTRGIIRVHQFQKLEMFSYIDPADAEAEHERLLALQEAMLQSLGLSYRVIDTAAGDLGSSAARKYDVEAWVPTQDAYRELTSTSNCTTYQARRLDIRYRTESGKTAPVATLNGTLATTRWLVAILETHQQADGSVVVPEPLRPYLGGLEVLEPRDERSGTGRDRWVVALDIDGTVLREDGSLGDADRRRGHPRRRPRPRGHARHRALGVDDAARSSTASASRPSSWSARTARSCSAATPTRRSATRSVHVEVFDPTEVLTTIRGHLEDASYAVEDEEGIFRYTGHVPRRGALGVEHQGRVRRAARDRGHPRRRHLARSRHRGLPLRRRPDGPAQGQLQRRLDRVARHRARTASTRRPACSS